MAIQEDIFNLQENNFKIKNQSYGDLLNRLAEILKKDISSSNRKKALTLQLPKIAREGAKKTIFLNFEETCLRIHREMDHVQSYISSELGTTASIQEGGGLVLRGKFQPKGIEIILKNYINEFVLCKSCKGIETRIVRNETNKLSFLCCEICKAYRTINPIKIGFMVQIKRKKK